MVLTVGDIRNRKQAAAAAGQGISEVLRDVLAEDAASEDKARMWEGERYYCGEHDILQRDFRRDVVSETVVDRQSGKEQEVMRPFQNPNRSNFRVVDAFHRLLVDQKAYYLVSREPGLRLRKQVEKSVATALEQLLSDFMDEQVNELVQELVVNTSNHGLGYLHIYYDEGGMLRFCVIPGMEIIPIYTSRDGAELAEVIRYYRTERVRNGHRELVYRVEWWTGDSVTYYLEEEPAHFVLDSEPEINPSPHWWEAYVGQESLPRSWGRVPFLVLRNNRRALSDLTYVKGLIDAYDLLCSEGVNNFADMVDLYWVIAGYGGETAAAIARKLRINRAVSVSDAGGRVEARQVELPVAGRIEFLQLLRRDIFHFGMGVDTSEERIGSDRLGNVASGVSLKFRYTQLELKAAGLAAGLKRVLREWLSFWLQDYNAVHHTAFEASMVSIMLNCNRVANDTETVEMIRNSAGLVSRKTLLGYHPFVEDVNEELTYLKMENSSGGHTETGEGGESHEAMGAIAGSVC